VTTEEQVKDRIKELAKEGLGYKRIAHRLQMKPYQVQKILDTFKPKKPILYRPGRDELKAHYDAGLSSAAIGEIYGVADNTITAWARRHGIGRRKEAYRDTVDQAYKLRGMGYTYKAIAKELRMSESWVNKICGHTQAGSAMRAEDDTVAIEITRHPEAPDMDGKRACWESKVAAMVLRQACFDLVTGDKPTQENAAEFFREGLHTMWCFLAGVDPDYMLTFARLLALRQATLPGGGTPKNYGITID